MKNQKPDDASPDAKAITKGLKKKEMDDLVYNVKGFLGLIGSIILGFIFHSFWVGIIAFFVFGYFAWRSWYKE